MRRPFSAMTAPTGDPVSLGGPDPGLIALDLSLSTAALTVTGGVALTGAIAAGTLAVAGTLALTGAADLEASAATLSGGALLAEGGGATLTVDGTLTLTGDAAAEGGGSILAGALELAGGTLDLDAISAIGIGGMADAGSIEVAAGGTLGGQGQIDAPLDDWGTALAQGGALALFGPATGGGTLAIGADGTLYAPDAISPSLTVAFAGPGATLELLTLAQGFVAPLTGFAAGDAIAFAEASVTGAVWQAGTLTLTAADGSSLALWLPGSFGGEDFLAIPDGGGSVVTLATAVIAGRMSAATASIAGQTALTGNAAIGTLTLAGTLAVQAGAALTAGDIAGAGLLVAEGAAAVTVADASALTATLDLLGGASAVLTAATLAGGALLLDAASRLGIGAAASQAGTLAIAAGSTLSGFGRLAAPVDVAGALLAQGGALVLGGAVGGGGSIAIAAGATLDDFAPVSVPVAFAPGGTLALEGAAFAGTLENFGAGDVLDIGGAAFDAASWSPGTLALLADGVTLTTLAIAGDYTGQPWQPTPDGYGGTLIQVAASDPPLAITGTQWLTGTLAVASATVAAGGTLVLAGGTLDTEGLTVEAGGALSGDGAIAGPLTAEGTVTAAGGALSVMGTITGGGTVEIGSGATLFAAGGIDTATGVAFTGQTATLELLAPVLGTGATIAGLEANPGNPFGNAIDIAGAQVTAAAYTDLGDGTGALALSGVAGSLGTLTLAALSAPPSILIQPDGSGGSLIELVPCFVAGTRIATPGGDVPVEHLRAGDWVFTGKGPRRLRWTGARRCDSTGAPELRPVRIAAGALGGGLPWRDLSLSPRHALWLRGALVPAAALVHGAAAQRARPGPVEYHHLGLDSHGTVWAEGVAAETWRPSGDAARFDREDGVRPLPGPACARSVEGGIALRALRRRIFGRAAEQPAPPAGALLGHVERIVHAARRTRIEGWALDANAPEWPVAMHVMHEGRRIGIALANSWRPDLDRAGLAGGNCVFVVILNGIFIHPSLHRISDGAMLSCSA